jgi:hypothetical protein
MSKVEERKKKFQLDERLKRNQLSVAAGIALVASVLLVIIFGGDLTEPARDLLGLDYYLADQEGVYADCRSAENRDNKFCQTHFSNAIRRGSEPLTPSERPGDSPPFRLYDQ